MEFTDVGAKLFEQITGANVKKRLAIILDNNVYSAPSSRKGLREEGPRSLAVLLRRRATIWPSFSDQGRCLLPSKFLSSEPWDPLSGGFHSKRDHFDHHQRHRHRSVHGPLLQGDRNHCGCGPHPERGFGVCGPRYFPGHPHPSGIAGLVLSIGMAVDANILVHERIKEELRWGKTVRAAIDQGYHRAFITIIDSNLTTLIAGVFLYQFGTGPVKGFAVTLCIGILANIFTAVYVTRLIFDFITLRPGMKQLSI